MGLWEEDNRGKVLFLSCHIKGSHYQHDITFNVDLSPLAELVVVKFLHYIFTLFYFFPFNPVLFGKKSCAHSHLSCGELYSSSRAQYLFKLFGTLLRGRFVSSFPFVSLFNHLFMLWTFPLYFEL